MDKAQHELVIKAIKVAKICKSNLRDVCFNTNETSEMIDLKMSRHWQEGKRAGYADAKLEFQEAIDKEKAAQKTIKNLKIDHQAEKKKLNLELEKMEQEIDKSKEDSMTVY